MIIFIILYLMIGVGFVIFGESVPRDPEDEDQENDALTLFGLLLTVVSWPVLLVLTTILYIKLRREYAKELHARAKRKPKV